jgi:hypothetical protein
MSQNGVTFENSVQVIGGTLGAGGNVAAVFSKTGKATDVVTDAVKTETKAAGNSTAITHWNAATGPGPLGSDIAKTFSGASYTEKITDDTITLYRVYGGKSPELGSYWTSTPPAGALQSRMDSAILAEWGNSAEKVVQIKVPKGTKIYEGTAAPQSNGTESFLGGGAQIYIPNVKPEWIAK